MTAKHRSETPHQCISTHQSAVINKIQMHWGNAYSFRKVRHGGHRLFDKFTQLKGSRPTNGFWHSESNMLRGFLEFHSLQNSSQDFYLATYSFSRNPGIKFQWRPCLFDWTSYSKSRNSSWPLLMNRLRATFLYEAILYDKSAHSRDPDLFTVRLTRAVIVRYRSCDTSMTRRTRAAENLPDRWIYWV